MQKIDSIPRDEIFDIYGVWYQPLWKTWQFKMAIVVVLLVVLFLVGYYIWVLIKRNRKTLPWISSIKELNRVEKKMRSGLYLGDNNKNFYFDLVLCIKKYFVVRYRIEEKGSTDNEMIEILEKLSIPSTIYEETQMIFEGAVTIKFANQKAAQEQMESDLARAFSIIKSSIPKENPSL